MPTGWKLTFDGVVIDTGEPAFLDRNVLAVALALLGQPDRIPAVIEPATVDHEVLYVAIAQQDLATVI